MTQVSWHRSSSAKGVLQGVLFEVTHKGGAVGRLAELLHGWQEQDDKTAMMAITISSSISIKPERRTGRDMNSSSKKEEAKF